MPDDAVRKEELLITPMRWCITCAAQHVHACDLDPPINCTPHELLERISNCGCQRCYPCRGSLRIEYGTYPQVGAGFTSGGWTVMCTAPEDPATATPAHWIIVAPNGVQIHTDSSPFMLAAIIVQFVGLTHFDPPTPIKPGDFDAPSN